MIIACPESTKRLAQRERDRCEGYRVNRTSQSLRGGFLTTRSSAGRLMGLWMRSFGDRGAAIVEAESMILARLRIAVKGRRDAMGPPAQMLGLPAPVQVN